MSEIQLADQCVVWIGELLSCSCGDFVNGVTGVCTGELLGLPVEPTRGGSVEKPTLTKKGLRLVIRRQPDGRLC